MLGSMPGVRLLNDVSDVIDDDVDEFFSTTCKIPSDGEVDIFRRINFENGPTARDAVSGLFFPP